MDLHPVVLPDYLHPIPAPLQPIFLAVSILSTAHITSQHPPGAFPPPFCLKNPGLDPTSTSTPVFLRPGPVPHLKPLSIRAIILILLPSYLFFLSHIGHDSAEAIVAMSFLPSCTRLSVKEGHVVKPRSLAHGITISAQECVHAGPLRNLVLHIVLVCFELVGW